MYRQHLRMVLVQDLDSSRRKSEFINRVASIPVVYLAWNIAADTYNSVKNSNKFFEVSLTTTEKAASFITKPVLKKFEKQLKSVDLIASKGVQALVEIVPFVLYVQQKLYKHTKDYYEEKVERGIRKYEMIKRLGTNKVLQLQKEGSEKLAEFRASPYGEVCELAMDFALDAGEMYVDHFLPPLGDERPEKLFGDRGKEPVLKRTELLRNRFKERLYKHTLLKIQILRLKTKYLIIKIYQIDPHDFIVNVSSFLSGVLLCTVTQMFSNLRDVITYLTVLLKLNQNSTQIM